MRGKSIGVFARGAPTFVLIGGAQLECTYLVVVFKGSRCFRLERLFQPARTPTFAGPACIQAKVKAFTGNFYRANTRCMAKRMKDLSNFSVNF